MMEHEIYAVAFMMAWICLLGRILVPVLCGAGGYTYLGGVFLLVCV